MAPNLSDLKGWPQVESTSVSGKVPKLGCKCSGYCHATPYTLRVSIPYLDITLLSLPAVTGQDRVGDKETVMEYVQVSG
jgi:hypothetical protein